MTIERFEPASRSKCHRPSPVRAPCKIWFNPAAFAVNPNGTFGETLRGEFFGPNRSTVDLGLFKRFNFSSDLNLQFRAEIFNLLNTVNFNNPNTTVNSAATFGRITEAQDPRIMQFGLKFLFRSRYYPMQMSGAVTLSDTQPRSASGVSTKYHRASGVPPTFLTTTVVQCATVVTGLQYQIGRAVQRQIGLGLAADVDLLAYRVQRQLVLFARPAKPGIGVALDAEERITTVSARVLSQRR